MAADLDGDLKHILVFKFKEGIREEAKNELFKAYANLVPIIPPMKSSHWGRNENRYKKDKGFSHVLQSTFESLEALDEYMLHPSHLQFADHFHSLVEDYMVIDYKPTTSSTTT